MNWTPLRHLIRRILKTPGFAAVTLLTLAIGIGSNTAIFSVMNGILFKPLPFADSDRLVGVWLSAAGLKIADLNASPSLYFLLREESQAFESVGMWRGNDVVVTGVAEPERVDALDVTPDLLNVLRIKPAAGRMFIDADGVEGSPRTVMITHGYCSKHFGGDAAAAIGKRLVLDGNAHEIVGVLPANFRFMDENPQMLLAMQFDRNKIFVGQFSYRGIARLKPGATMDQATADMNRMIPLMMRKFSAPPGFSMKMMEDAGLKSNLRPLKTDLVGSISTLLWVLAATVGIVLFIACANVANLLLVRAEGRQHELAIRSALGASRGDLIKELLTESILLSLTGGLLGLGVAYGLIRMLVAYAPARLPRLNEIGMDPVVFAFALAVSVFAGILFGLIPVFKYAGGGRGSSSISLREGGGRNASQGRERHRARAVLVVAQVALALVLLVGAGLMIRTFQALMGVDPGFQKPNELLTVSLAVPEAQVPDPDRVIAMYREMLRKIGEIPGVESVAVGGSVPLDGNNNNDPIFAEDRAYRDGEMAQIRRYKRIAPGMLRTLGIPLLAGRDLTWDDIRNRSSYILVSDALAREYWGEPAKAIGKRVRERPGGVWREVIGVVGEVRDDGLAQAAPKTAYWPIVVKSLWTDDVNVSRWVTFAVRSPRTGSSSLVSAVRSALWSVDPSIPIANVRTLQSLVDRSLARTSFTMVMLGMASFMALLLGIIGIYGVISYSVAQRTREIGIRTALGATSGEVRGMFVRHALLLAGIGVVIGLAAAFALTRWMSSLLYGVNPLDSVTFLMVPAILAAAAGLASYIPARRATRLDPMTALRTE